jgi:hypothetical protein
MLSAKPSMPLDWASWMSDFQVSWVKGKVLPTIMWATTTLSPVDDGMGVEDGVVDEADVEDVLELDVEVDTGVVDDMDTVVDEVESDAVDDDDDAILDEVVDVEVIETEESCVLEMDEDEEAKALVEEGELRSVTVSPPKSMTKSLGLYDGMGTAPARTQSV